MTTTTWHRDEPSGGGIDCWHGESILGNTWLVTMWFGDEDSGGELKPDEFAIELCMLADRKWVGVTYDELKSRQEVLDCFEQMKATCD